MKIFPYHDDHFVPALARDTMRRAAMVTPNMFKDAPSDSAAIQSAVDFAASRDEYRRRSHPEVGDTRDISIANVSSCSGAAIRVFEGVENLQIENVEATGGAETALLVKDHTTFRNCSIRGIKCTPTARIGSVIDLHEAHGDLLVSGVEAHGARHVLRLSDSDINVTLENDKVENLAGERIARLKQGDPDCGPHIPDLVQPIEPIAANLHLNE